MHKQSKKGFIGLLFLPQVWIIIIIIILGILMIKIDFSKINLSIFPELDNRITYFDTLNDMTQFVCNENPPLGECTQFENDKLLLFKDNGADGGIGTDGILQVSCGYRTGSAHYESKKDFARLKSYARIKNYGRFAIGDDGGVNQLYFPVTIGDEWNNIEVIPDNLNAGTYYTYINGEFYKKIENLNEVRFFGYCIGGGGGGSVSYVLTDYIKYVPIESYSIKNDEVWVKEVRGSSYSFSDLNWEMIGYQSEIRPATIRDLTAQTEVPAPQIYINLINNLPIVVQSNTIHTLYYRTKWTQGLDSSCQGQLDKVEVKGSDGSWYCESYVKETPIIQQCQTKIDCPILPECESQKDLMTCNNNLCDFTAFSPACKNQLITYQEKVTEIENTKFVPIISGSNSFYCFFDKTSSGCNIGEKTISVSAPSYVCALPSDSSTLVSTGRQADNCWKTTISFLDNSYDFINNEVNDNIGSNIKAEISIGASLDSTRKLRDDWGIAGKFILPDNFLDINPKLLGNKFILQNSNEPITFTITNNLGFGIDGGYTIQTQNLALEGGVVLKDEDKGLFLNNGDNDITYNFNTEQLGTIVDIIGIFGKIKTDKEYILKSGQFDGSILKEKYLIITKEVKTSIPVEIEKVQPKVEIVEKIVEKTIIIKEPNPITSFFNKIWLWIKNIFT